MTCRAARIWIDWFDHWTNSLTRIIHQPDAQARGLGRRPSLARRVGVDSNLRGVLGKITATPFHREHYVVWTAVHE